MDWYKRFVWELNNILNFKNADKELIFLCIGTSSVTGDSFGPTVGSNLKKIFSSFSRINVFGDLENNISYNDIDDVMKLIGFNSSRKLIIVVDSALSTKSDIGKLFVQNNGLKYAECLNKKNCLIGDVSIKAVVGVFNNNILKNFNTLMQVKPNTIESMSTSASQAISNIILQRV